MTAHRTVRPIPARDLEAIYRPRQFPALVDFTVPEAYLPIGTRHSREITAGHELRKLVQVRTVENAPARQSVRLSFFVKWVVAVAMVYGLIVGAMAVLP
jgi:hypothetical protein